MALWRQTKHSPFKRLQKGWADLPSVNERAKETVRMAKENGRDLHLVGDRYRHF